jgi:hypothetical protein
VLQRIQEDSVAAQEGLVSLLQVLCDTSRQQEKYLPKKEYEK